MDNHKQFQKFIKLAQELDKQYDTTHDLLESEETDLMIHRVIIEGWMTRLGGGLSGLNLLVFGWMYSIMDDYEGDQEFDSINYDKIAAFCNCTKYEVFKAQEYLFHHDLLEKIEKKDGDWYFRVTDSICDMKEDIYAQYCSFE